MGRVLLASEPAFRAAVEACDAECRKLTGAWAVLDELAADPERSRLTDIGVAQCLTFAVQVGLTALLAAWGHRQEAVTGHSLGEVAAAHAPGILSLAYAARAVSPRSRLQAYMAGQGGRAHTHPGWAQRE